MFFSKTEQIIPDFKLCYEHHFQRLQTHVKSIPEQSPTGCVKYHIRCGNIIQSDHKKRLKAINFTLCFCCGSFGKQLNPSANYEINTKQLGYLTTISVHFDDKSAFCVVSMLWWWCGQNYSNLVNNESKLSICQSW